MVYLLQAFSSQINCIKRLAIFALARLAGVGKDLRWAEVLLQHDVHATHHLSQQEVLGGLVQGRLIALVPALGSGQTEGRRVGTGWGCCAGH